MKKLIAMLLAMLLCICLLGGCAETPDTNDDNSGSSDNAGDSVSNTNDVGTAYADKTAGFQLELPAVGDQVAVMETTMGTLYIRFFPEGAPKTVENFVTHSKNGYYDGLTFHRVISDFMIQGGDPKGNGTGGESVWGGKFADEFDQKLLNLRGSLAMANSGVDTNGSQFFINQGDAEAFSGSYTTREAYQSSCDANVTYLTQQYQQMVNMYGESTVAAYYGSLASFINAQAPNFAPNQETWDLYKQHGGNLHLDGAWRRSGGHTVFAQVYAGMDVVDAIAEVEVNSDNKPLEDVKIVKITITTYGSDLAPVVE